MERHIAGLGNRINILMQYSKLCRKCTCALANIGLAKDMIDEYF